GPELERIGARRTLQILLPIWKERLLEEKQKPGAPGELGLVNADGHFRIRCRREVRSEQHVPPRKDIAIVAVLHPKISGVMDAMRVAGVEQPSQCALQPCRKRGIGMTEEAFEGAEQLLHQDGS